jgi:hypothetical protein
MIADNGINTGTTVTDLSPLRQVRGKPPAGTSTALSTRRRVESRGLP